MRKPQGARKYCPATAQAGARTVCKNHHESSLPSLGVPATRSGVLLCLRSLGLLATRSGVLVYLGSLGVVLVLPLPSCTVRCRKKHAHDEPPTASVVSGLDAHCAAGPPDFDRPVNSTEMQARKSWLLVLASPAQGGPVDTTTIQRMAGKSSEPEIGDLLKGCGVPGYALVFWGSCQ